MSEFSRVIKDAPFILTEGAIIERLKREFKVELDPYIIHAGMIYDNHQSKTLDFIYHFRREDSILNEVGWR